MRVLYIGNLGIYGPMVEQVLRESCLSSRVRFEVRCPQPNWGSGFVREMQARGCLHGFAPQRELDIWLGTASAFLVAMTFEKSAARRMKTSFPSKLVEISRFGRPLVVWGPEYCSAVRWARETDRALCVTDRSPSAVIRALEGLARSGDEQVRLGDAALHAAKNDFEPNRLHRIFMKNLFAES